MTVATSSYEWKIDTHAQLEQLTLLLCTKYLHCHSEAGEQSFHCQHLDSFLYWSAESAARKAN
jgi:hypothetical protein